MMKASMVLPVVLTLSVLACNNQKPTSETPNIDDPSLSESVNVPRNLNKEAYFGETHIHTTYSMDAYIGGNRLTTEEAYKFASGGTVISNGREMKLKRPLDFCAITDHAEYIGEVYTLSNPSAPGYDDPVAVSMREADNLEDAMALFVKYVIKNNRSGNPKHADFFQGEATIKSAWQINKEATEKYYQPGTFTTFHAFEWSAAPNAGNLHRNIIFRDNVLPAMPFSAIDGSYPEELWNWMKEAEQNGSTLFAIPHNSNGSKGLMFSETDYQGNPLDKEYAETRQRLEPLIEMMQIKGNSEVYPKFWPTDEFANFENAPSIQDFSGRSFEKMNFVRDGLEQGLAYQSQLGVNPYKLGFVGGTDNHNGLPSNVEEDNYWVGSHGLADNTPEARVNNTIEGWAKAYDISPGALTGVWAEANTREDLFDAMKARETFATSGPRMKVRFFGGYNLQDIDFNSQWVDDAYAAAVPMGSDLSTTNGQNSPEFIVWASKDPIGPNLDRIQIIKGWYQDGEKMEKIYNVAVSDGREIDDEWKVEPVNAPINLETGAFNMEKGSPELAAVWSDPDFHPEQHAFYYVRVLQLPTARWTLWDEIRHGVSYPQEVPKSIVERAWSSPIWYTPL